MKVHELTCGRSERSASLVEASLDGIVVSADVRAAAEHRGSLRHQVRGGRSSSRSGAGSDQLRDHPFDVRSQLPGGARARRRRRRCSGCEPRRASTAAGRYRNVDESRWSSPAGATTRSPSAGSSSPGGCRPHHVTVVDGFPVTTLARTFFDLCGDPDEGLHLRHPIHERKMKQLYNDCLARRGMTLRAWRPRCSPVLARRGGAARGWSGLLEQFGPDHMPTQSDTETLFLELIRDRALPEPERQVAIAGADGWIGTVDFAWRRAAARRGDRLGVARRRRSTGGHDAERDRRLREAGYTVAPLPLPRPRRRARAAIARELGAAIGGRPPIAAPRTVGLRLGLEALDDHGHALAAADAHGLEAVAAVGVLEAVDAAWS